LSKLRLHVGGVDDTGGPPSGRQTHTLFGMLRCCAAALLLHAATVFIGDPGLFLASAANADAATGSGSPAPAGNDLGDLDAQWEELLDDDDDDDAGAATRRKSQGKKKRRAAGGKAKVKVVEFRHCRSHRKTYEEYRDRILKFYPKAEINHVTTEPPHPAPFASKAVATVQWSLLGILLAGKNVFDAIGLPLPGFWPRNMAAQGPTAIFVHMIGNQLSDQLMHSNDFDVLVDGVLVWSKTSAGHAATWPETIAALESAGFAHMEGSDETNQFVAGWNTEG